MPINLELKMKPQLNLFKCAILILTTLTSGVVGIAGSTSTAVLHPTCSLIPEHAAATSTGKQSI